MTTVLVVDDDPDIQLLLRLELQAEGHVVVTADNGLEALDRIPALGPDVVLLDVICLLYTSPSPRDLSTSRMPSSA